MLFRTTHGCRLQPSRATTGTNIACSSCPCAETSGPVGRWSSVLQRAVKRLSEFVSGCLNRRVEGAGPSSQAMVERLLPAEDPVLENVLKWTVERDAKDVRRLLEWLPEARSSRERKALLQRVRGLLTELEAALDELDNMH